MPDWQVGYPPTPTLANRGDGRTRVTFAAWELDSWFFDQITTAGACYLQNCTLAAVSQIIGKGGTERTGYWFDAQVAFGAWAAGNRIAPQRSAAVNWNTTVAAAFAAAANLDSLLCWYASIGNRRWWTEVLSNAATLKHVDFFGMLPRRKFLFYVANNFYFLNLNGVLPALARKIMIRNITTTGRNGGSTPNYFLYYNDTGGVGTGIVVDSVFTWGWGDIIQAALGAARAVEIRNSSHWGIIGINISAGGPAVIAYNNTFLFGFSTFLNTPSWVYNNVAFLQNTLGASWVSVAAPCVFQNNGSWDATGNVGLRNLRMSLSNLWWGASYGNLVYDMRATQASAPLVGGGQPLAAVPIDCDNNPRSLTTPTVGWHEGTQKPYQNYVPPRPENFAMTNLGTDSDLLFSWENGADYLALDDMLIVDALGVEVARARASAGQIVIGGMLNQAAYFNISAVAVSDNGVRGPVSRVAGNTPTQRIIGRTTIHLTCDAAADEEEIWRYYWFVGTSLAATQALRLAVQALIDARLPLTGFAAVTDMPDLEQAGYLVANPAADYWGFVVAMDEDGVCTPTNAADIAHIVANPGSGTLTANTHIRIMEAVEPALYPIM